MECTNAWTSSCRYSSKGLPSSPALVWLRVQPIRFSTTVIAAASQARRLLSSPIQAAWLTHAASQSQTSYEWLQLLHDDYKVVVGVDIGTRNSSACWRRIHKNTRITPQNVIDALEVQVAGEWRIPTEVAPVRDGDGYKLIFGPEVETYLADAEILNDEAVFRLLKLSLITSNESRFSEDGTTHEGSALLPQQGAGVCTQRS